MSDIVIRHAEPKDIDAIRQIHAQPEVYHNTLQVPHPSEHMWRERLTDTPGVKHTMIDMCDNWLRVERIELTVFADNAPAIAVYKKYGFEIEGTGRRYALRNGEYVDAYYMARMK